MPRVTISINAPNEATDQELLTLDLPTGLTVQDLKAFVEAETTFPATAQHFFLNGMPLTNEAQTLEDAGVKDGEMLAVLVRRPGNSAQGQATRPAPSTADNRRRGGPDPEAVRQHMVNNPTALASLSSQAPQLAALVNDSNRWRDEFLRMAQAEEEQAREHQNRVNRLNMDPMDVEAQRQIEEMIRQERVMENVQHALDHNPEVFGRVHMLYVNAEVNGHPVKAFVDSGAQATVMSPSCAEACGIMRYLDTRWSGLAMGVGTAKILGRVHHAEISMGGAVMPCSFTVMEGKDVDLLFGLDMLRRYKAKIDLEKDALCFQGIEVPFLPEHELPKRFFESELNEPTIPGPDGTEIGGYSGAVRPAGETSKAAAKAADEPQPSEAPPKPSPSSSSSSATLAASSEEFPLAHIEQLIQLGASRQNAINALRAANGDVELAGQLLMG